MGIFIKIKTFSNTSQNNFTNFQNNIVIYQEVNLLSTRIYQRLSFKYALVTTTCAAKLWF